ncbi:hypothetical protein U7230_10755 [Carboxydochorda subterranea]|uniref:Uncharacterized protein n=1 Tax=Carboxydichorda subterranea TaxID=3109565 RepID=A0ABZ1BUU6_9FIRM|nr:hypothetical protein [Limnochorda sp. L945t]WRP16569.1 hypothetical protein U7230_10755 [Limnochorda sp. L945t]
MTGETWLTAEAPCFPYLLGDEPPAIPAGLARRVASDFERFAERGLPEELEAYVRETFGIDLTGRYGGRPIRNPFGKASGQLSLSIHQIEADQKGGLGFAVLKTVIAQDARGRRGMAAWAVPVSRMKVQPIAGRRVARLGWTVTWAGRGWSDSFEDYLELWRQAAILARERGWVVAASAKFYVPAEGRGEPEKGAPADTLEDVLWRREEYDFTVQGLLRVWADCGMEGPMLLEQDFSPTLAGHTGARDFDAVLEWVRRSPLLVRAAAAARGATAEGAAGGDATSAERLTLGLKLFNTLFADEWQLRLLQEAIRPDPEGPHFVVYANRLFDPRQETEGVRGAAYGGPDLSHRNLAILTRLRAAQHEGAIPSASLPLSGTGDVSSGRLAVEYALRGAESLQIHTLFQLPDLYYPMRRPASKTQKALHLLLFHPREGLIPWMLHLKSRWGVEGTFDYLALTRWHRTAEGGEALARLAGACPGGVEAGDTCGK